MTSSLNSGEQTGLEIAIVGMAGRFPGANDIGQFWRNLRDGVEAITFFTDEELLAAGVEANVLNDPSYVKARGVLEGAELFDASFFGYSPREAEVMDPQQRLFLECAWQALEAAGYDSAAYRKPVGVYAGVGMNTYAFNLLSHPELIQTIGNFQVMTSNDKDYLPTRVSYKLNLIGPSVNIQTACSTSLVAVHFACQGLLSGECEMALAGGVSVAFPQIAGYVYQRKELPRPTAIVVLSMNKLRAQSLGTVSAWSYSSVSLMPSLMAITFGPSSKALRLIMTVREKLAIRRQALRGKPRLSRPRTLSQV